MKNCRFSILNRVRMILLCLAILGTLCCPLWSAAQCSNTLSTSRYDTVLTTSTGYGNFKLSFPQWKPDSGTLVSVKVQALVSLKYGFTLTNMDAVPSVYTLRVGRQDKITSPAMATYTNVLDQEIGDYPLDPGHSTTVPPFSFMDGYPNTDSITAATAPFIGFDSVHFVYLPITYTNLRADNNASYNFRATAADTIRFSITYLHCSQVTLASSLTRFEAVLEDPASVRLSWTVVNEQPGRYYQIQQSRDGQHFTGSDSLASVAGDPQGAHYQIPYTLPGGSATGNWYFRLKIKDARGGYSYSEIKEVAAGAAHGGLWLYPNPATTFVNLVWEGSSAGDWQVGLFDSGGGLVLTDHFLNARAGRLDFRHKLSAGTYFIRATDQRTGKTIVSSLLVPE